MYVYTLLCMYILYLYVFNYKPHDITTVWHIKAKCTIPWFASFLFSTKIGTYPWDARKHLYSLNIGGKFMKNLNDHKIHPLSKLVFPGPELTQYERYAKVLTGFTVYGNIYQNRFGIYEWCLK